VPAFLGDVYQQAAAKDPPKDDSDLDYQLTEENADELTDEEAIVRTEAISLA
jgi:hypothetical protein